jgi:hypothetical protein
VRLYIYLGESEGTALIHSVDFIAILNCRRTVWPRCWGARADPVRIIFQERMREVISNRMVDGADPSFIRRRMFESSKTRCEESVQDVAADGPWDREAAGSCAQLREALSRCHQHRLHCQGQRGPCRSIPAFRPPCCRASCSR